MGRLSGLFQPSADTESEARNHGRHKGFVAPSWAEYQEARSWTTAPPSAGVIMTTGLFDDLLVTLRKTSAFLKAVPTANVIRMDNGTLVLPKVTDDGSAAWVAEGAVIPRQDGTLASNTLKAHKLARISVITSEALQDSGVDARQAISAALVRSLSYGLDDALFNGTGTGQPLGVLKASGVVKTALTAAVTLDNLSDEMTAIEAQGGTPTAIVADPATYGILRKAKASGAGTYHLSPYAQSDGPGTLWGVPLVSAPRLAPGTVIVMDGTQVYVGVRRDATVSYQDLFDTDEIGCRITTRWAGVELLDTKAVRILTGATGP